MIFQALLLPYGFSFFFFLSSFPSRISNARRDENRGEFAFKKSPGDLRDSREGGKRENK